MKKILSLLLLLPFLSFAQVGVNTTTPKAALDVESTNNGVLIPRVQLTFILDNTTIVNPDLGPLETSTLVYNMAAAGTVPNNVVAGFYYWNYDRGSYSDSLFADTTGRGDLVIIEIINVPALNQKDWSGGLNAGVDFNINIFEPVWLNLSANYKLIIAELWPTLDLNLENVSGLQFFDFRAGINLRL